MEVEEEQIFLEVEDSQSNTEFEYETFEELLIVNVQARPVLWDSKLKPSAKTKTEKDQCWLDIYEFFGKQYPIELLQKKWRNLRDTYVRVKGEIDSYMPSGSAAKKKKTWKHYELMKFLSCGLVPRPTSSNIETNSGNSTPELLHTPKGKKQNESGQTNAIIEVLKNMGPAPSMPELPSINPICLKISELLEHLEPREKTRIEIKLLQLAYNEIFSDNYLAL